uniref:Uncharacterized protein n=1 Tax=Candidatus Methanophagaceae archaeon ANME-1 ERB6 TaxID=2759912 RepID=A0A7G9YZF3_9EURY|nr:hypothetical protein OJFPBHNK_00013 [Methanosarcinales archaeon ANME-1 ERB6]
MMRNKVGGEPPTPKPMHLHHSRIHSKDVNADGR